MQKESEREQNPRDARYRQSLREAGKREQRLRLAGNPQDKNRSSGFQAKAPALLSFAEAGNRPLPERSIPRGKASSASRGRPYSAGLRARRARPAGKAPGTKPFRPPAARAGPPEARGMALRAWPPQGPARRAAAFLPQAVLVICSHENRSGSPSAQSMEASGFPAISGISLVAARSFFRTNANR